MPSYRSRSSRKQPPSQREVQKEPQKEKKKTLQELVFDLKKKFALEYQARLESERRTRDNELADEQMALIYGPGWKQGLPQWASEFNNSEAESQTEAPESSLGVSEGLYSEYDSDEDRRVIPFPRASEIRLKGKKQRAS